MNNHYIMHAILAVSLLAGATSSMFAAAAVGDKVFTGTNPSEEGAASDMSSAIGRRGDIRKIIGDIDGTGFRGSCCAPEATCDHKRFGSLGHQFASLIRDASQDLLLSEINEYLKLGGNLEGLLHTAARSGTPQTIKNLVTAAEEQGFRDYVNESDEYGRTPLCLARSPEVAQELIRLGAHVNGRYLIAAGRDNNVSTPLHEAARDLNEKMVRVLLRWRAYASATNPFGQNPLMVVAGHKFEKQEYELESMAAERIEQEQKNQTIIAELLLASKNDAGVYEIDLAATDYKGKTAFDLACDAGNEAIAGKLAVAQRRSA